jgi:hypothetical protein
MGYQMATLIIKSQKLHKIFFISYILKKRKNFRSMNLKIHEMNQEIQYSKDGAEYIITSATSDQKLPINNVDEKYQKKTMPKSMRTRSVMVTLWEDYWNEEDFNVSEETKHLQWLVIGAEEKCPTTGKIHFHAVAQCTRVKSIVQWKQLFQCEKMHVLPRKGTFAQCYKYITKDGPPIFEYGKLPVQGARTDLHALRDAVKEGKKDKTIIEDDTLVRVYAKHLPFVNKLKQIYAPRRKKMTECIWYHGPPGTGKSTMAQYNAEKEAPDDVYYKPAGSWWDGYTGQKIVILEDIKSGEMTTGEFCRLIDSRPLQVPVKGGFEQFTSSKVYVTSNYTPKEIFWGHGIERRTKNTVTMEAQMHPEQAQLLMSEIE